MRSGFVAGDASLLKPYLQYRTYHGAAMPVQHQLASIAALGWMKRMWKKTGCNTVPSSIYFNRSQHLLPLKKPDAGFYYWLKVDNDEAFAKR